MYAFLHSSNNTSYLQRPTGYRGPWCYKLSHIWFLLAELFWRSSPRPDPSQISMSSYPTKVIYNFSKLVQANLKNSASFSVGRLQSASPYPRRLHLGCLAPSDGRRYTYMRVATASFSHVLHSGVSRGLREFFCRGKFLNVQRGYLASEERFESLRTVHKA